MWERGRGSFGLFGRIFQGLTTQVLCDAVQFAFAWQAWFYLPRQESFPFPALGEAAAAIFHLPQVNCTAAGPWLEEPPCSSPKPQEAEPGREAHRKAPAQLLSLLWRGGHCQRATRLLASCWNSCGSSTFFSMKAGTVSLHVLGRGISPTFAPFSRHFWVFVPLCVWGRG